MNRIIFNFLKIKDFSVIFLVVMLWNTGGSIVDFGIFGLLDV